MAAVGGIRVLVRLEATTAQIHKEVQCLVHVSKLALFHPQDLAILQLDFAADR